MTRERQERVLLASVVTAIVVFFMLITIMGYQIVKITTKNREYNALVSEIARLEELRDQTTDEIQLRLLDEAIEERARELGLKFPNDK